MSELRGLLDQIDMETYFDREGIDYKITSGSRGTQLNVKTCPACGVSKWKVYIGANTGLGNCFSGSCEQRFNKYSFIKAHLSGSSTAELARHIKTVAQEQGWRSKRKIEFVTFDNDSLKVPDSVELPFNGKNLKYLTSRGIDDETCRYFHLRYSKSGVFRYMHEGRERIQDYSGRIIIPIYNIDGEMVSFQGRDITGESEKKYLFPPGYASTGKYLYNSHNAIGAKRIVICEGVFDVMATKMALEQDMELFDVVPTGSFGKHLSNGFGGDQIEQIIALKRRGLKEVCFMWDGEKEAIRAAIKSAIVIAGMGIKATVAMLPKGCDPNEASAVDVIRAYRNAERVTRATAVKLITKLAQY